MANAETFIDEIKGLLTRNMEANTQLASRVSGLLQQSAREGLPATPNELFARWLDFNLASATVISTHSTEVMRGLVDAAERSLLGRALPSHEQGVPNAGTTPPTAATPIDLHVEGTPGETVRAPFLIANEYDRPLEVSFEASPLRDEAGREIAVGQVTFEPGALTLARGQRVVQAAIAIPDKAAVGATYRGEVRIKGYQARTIALALSVVARDSASEAAQESTAASTPRAAAGAAARAAKGSSTSGRGAKGDSSGRKSSRGKKRRSGGKAQE